LFTAYTKPLSAEISAQDIDHELYADDSQLWIAFNPRSITSTDNATDRITKCLTHIKHWMDTHFLKMKSSKTELLILSTPQAHRTLNLSSNIKLQIEGSEVEPSPHACNLGVNMDQTMSMETQVNSICKKAHYQLHNIKSIRKYLDENATRAIVQALVMSRVDYCNSLYLGLPATLLHKLQLVQNKRLYLFLDHHSFFHESQYGFRPNHSTIDAVTEFTQNIYKSMENNELSVGVFLDLSKAFDTINLNIMIDKLRDGLGLV
jgi:hypothetical protein